MNELAHPNNTPNIIIERGKRAYQKIKVDAATMRENWRAVGEALLVGKDKTNREAGQSFDEWCTAEGFDFGKSVRADVIWFAQNFSECSDFLRTHPSDIRKEYNEATKLPQVLPSDLSEITPEPIVELDQRSAEKITKLVKRSQASDEGSELAKRHVKILAEKHGTTVEKLERAAARKVPELYHGLTPIQIDHIKQMEEAIKQTCIEMVEDGFTRESVKDIFYKFVDAL